MLILLAILTLVTVAAVAGGTYLLAQRLAGPIRVLRNSLDELAHGRYDYRIGDPRTDEIGELFADFDRTAEALEKRHGHADAAPGAHEAEVACARAWLAFVAVLAMGGCATPPRPVVEPVAQPERGPVVAQDDDLRSSSRRPATPRTRWRSAIWATRAKGGGSRRPTATRSGRARSSSCLCESATGSASTRTAIRRCPSSAITGSAPRRASSP